jgi:hypothetical protein
MRRRSEDAMAKPSDGTTVTPQPAPADQARISPPYAYSEIVPLRKEDRVLLPEAGKVGAIFRSLNALPVSLAEFTPASREYPIVFVSADSGKTYAVFVVLGLEKGLNLFAMPDGGWDRRAYLPAYVRRYPFCMATITVDGKMREERLVCVEKNAVRDEGERLVDDAGKALPDWEQQQKLLFEFEADLVRTNELCATLASYGLLEPFTMQARPNEGAPISVAGMGRVNEQKLAALEPEQVKTLMSRGYLGAIYAHLMSLGNFQRLLARRAGLAGRQAETTPSAQGASSLS